MNCRRVGGGGLSSQVMLIWMQEVWTQMKKKMTGSMKELLVVAAAAEAGAEAAAEAEAEAAEAAAVAEVAVEAVRA
jgi:hypothetical protein